MAANTLPVFPITVNSPQARIAAANTARDGSGSLVTLFTAGANGSRVNWIKWTSAQASAAATSGMVGRVFETDTSGLNPRLVGEVQLPTVTASNTAIGATQQIDMVNGIIIPSGVQFGINGGKVLQSGQILKVTQSIYAGVQDQMDVTSDGGDF